uniref:C2H2-type domain-containing protein n=1 Tax=Ditylenchus dipsaci TaxID=166011 RepID=A0A915CT64_9BILA
MHEHQQQKVHRPAFSKQKEDARAKVADVVDSVVEKLRLQQHTTTAAVQHIYNAPSASTINYSHQSSTVNQPCTINQAQPSTIVNHQQKPIVNHHQQLSTVNNHHHQTHTVNSPPITNQSSIVSHPPPPSTVNQASVVDQQHHSAVSNHQQSSTVKNHQQLYGHRVCSEAGRGAPPLGIAPPQYPQGWTHNHPTPPPLATVNPPLSQPSTIKVNQQPQKNVYRHLCPECSKPYSCRKNVKRHRVSVHKLTEAEVLALNVQQGRGGGDSKAVTTTPIYGTPNPGLPTNSNQQQPTEISGKYPLATNNYPPQQYPNYHYYNDQPQHEQAPFSAPPTFSSSNHFQSTPFSWGSDDTRQYITPNKKVYPSQPPAMYTAYGCQYYEPGDPAPAYQNAACQHRHSFDATTNTTPTSNTYNNNWADLDYWDQIKSNVDGPLVSRSRDDDLEMARIAEDLKRSAEGEVGLNRQGSLSETNDSDVFLAKKPVELVLAEADSTFWEEELEGLTATTTECQFIQSKPVTLLSPISATVSEPMEKKLRRSLPATPLITMMDAESKEEHQKDDGKLKRKLKKPAKSASEQGSPPELSNRAPVEYSLKRHKQICQKYKDTKKGLKTELKFVLTDGLVNFNASDPDSTTTFSQTAINETDSGNAKAVKTEECQK